MGVWWSRHWGNPHNIPWGKEYFGAMTEANIMGGTLTKKSGKFFRVGIFLDFVWLTTRTPHGAYVRRARRNRIDRHGG